MGQIRLNCLSLFSATCYVLLLALQAISGIVYALAKSGYLDCCLRCCPRLKQKLAKGTPEPQNDAASNNPDSDKRWFESPIFHTTYIAALQIDVQSFAPLLNPDIKCTLTVAVHLLLRVPHVRDYFKNLSPSTAIEGAFKRIVLSLDASSSTPISVNEIAKAAAITDMFSDGGTQTYRVVQRLLELLPKYLQALFETGASVSLNCGCNVSLTLSLFLPRWKSRQREFNRQMILSRLAHRNA